MPSSSTKLRIDWVPGAAALDALAIAEALFPGQGRQDVIDRMLIMGVSAYLANHWQPPQFQGRSRHRWRLPAELEAAKNPGK